MVKRNLKLKELIKDGIAVVEFPIVVAAAIAAKFNKALPDNVWLIGEMGVDAKDNGAAFFQYLNENHPEINSVYYVDSHYPAYTRMKNVGQVVQTNSFKHKQLMFKAKYILSTHDSYAIPWGKINWKQFKRVYGWLNSRLKFVFLQHGVTKDDASSNASYESNYFDYFITTTPDEDRDIATRYGFSRDQVLRVGMSRYDLLSAQRNVHKNKQILFCPTWRYYLADVSKVDFEASQYFASIHGFLADPRLIDLLKQSGYELLFFPPHREVQKFIDLFNDVKSDVIKIIQVDTANVSDLIVHSAMMISDFSSIVFDSAFLENRIAYYQFDLKEYRDGQYKQGYFSYENDGFGPVVNTKDALIDEISNALSQHFSVAEKYKLRMKKAFPERDGRNSERLFNILEGSTNGK